MDSLLREGFHYGQPKETLYNCEKSVLYVQKECGIYRPAYNYITKLLVPSGMTFPIE